LRALAEQARGREAGPNVEARLVEAFRARHSARTGPRHNPRRLWVWMAAAAASLALAAIVIVQESGSAPPPSAPAIARAPALPAVVPPPQAPASPVLATPAKRKRPARPAAPRVSAPVKAEAVAQDSPEESSFIALPYAAGLAPEDELDVVRVRLPRTAIVRFGIPVSGERAWEPVSADVAFGPDGIARAVRFVK